MTISTLSTREDGTLADPARYAGRLVVYVGIVHYASVLNEERHTKGIEGNMILAAVATSLEAAMQSFRQRLEDYAAEPRTGDGEVFGAKQSLHPERSRARHFRGHPVQAWLDMVVPLDILDERLREGLIFSVNETEMERYLGPTNVHRPIPFGQTVQPWEYFDPMDQEWDKQEVGGAAPKFWDNFDEKTRVEVDRRDEELKKVIVEAHRVATEKVEREMRAKKRRI